MNQDLLRKINKLFENAGGTEPPKYDPKSHTEDLATNKYWNAILYLRHVLKLASDDFFSVQQNGINVDLFMLTPSVSSPMGPGSDSEAVAIQFGNLDTFLVDSSQFGFEPILMNNFNLLYCYLPSMRGENPDKRHLNQFFHCEAEMRGNLTDIMQLVEKYIKYVTQAMLDIPFLIHCLSGSPEHSKQAMKMLASLKSFKKIDFNSAIKILEEHGHTKYINYTDHGRDISSIGEIELSKIFSPNEPFWITNFDRDRVPFYQKPDPENTNQVLNADLIFPPLIEFSFGGEIVGCGQRQDRAVECYESLKRQNIPPDPYYWYINLRDLPQYSSTAGFGMGIERYITWLLCKDDIKDVIPYPRLKNIKSYP